MARTKARAKKGPFYINKNGSLEWRGPITFYDAPALDGPIVAYILQAVALGMPASAAIRDLCRNGGAKKLAKDGLEATLALPPEVHTADLGDDL